MDFADDDIDYTQIPISALIGDTNALNLEEGRLASSIEQDMESLSTRVEQYQWIVSWLEKHQLYKTLDTLLDEGAEIASESFGLGKAVTIEEEATDYAKALASSYEAHTGQNILASQFHPNPELDLVATGSTDRTAAILNWKTGEKLATIYGAHIAPILCMDWHPKASGRLVMGSLDSSFSVVDIKGLASDAAPEAITYDVLTQQKLHKKHVVRVKWSPCGTRFATASYDHFMRIMEERVNADTGEITYEQIKEFEFIEAVEALVWTKDGKFLIVAIRKDNYLHYFNPADNWSESKFNMNSNQADDHVSFTAMDLSLSRDDKYLLVITDKSRAIMFAVATPLQVRNFYDIPNGEWSTPRGVFNQSGAFIYISSEDKGIYVYNTVTGGHVTTLVGHTSNIRDVASHPTLDVVASASFDKTVKIWQ